MASATVDGPATGAGAPEPSAVEVTQQIAEVADRVRMSGESILEVLGRVAVTTKKTMDTVDAPATGAGAPEPSAVEVVPELTVEVTQQIADVADLVRMPGESLFEVLGRVAVMTKEERTLSNIAASKRARKTTKRITWIRPTADGGWEKATTTVSQMEEWLKYFGWYDVDLVHDCSGSADNNLPSIRGFLPSEEYGNHYEIHKGNLSHFLLSVKQEHKEDWPEIFK